jgi:molecular chaperone DnaK (HSP70)
VDLGTTISVVGFNKDGKVIIVEDKAGHKIFPSIVSYLDNGGEMNLSSRVPALDTPTSALRCLPTEIKAGYDALPYLSTQPENTIYNAKRFIGRRYACLLHVAM